MPKTTALFTPLSDDDFDALGELLEACSPFDVDGVCGLLTAVAIAPSLVPPATWLQAIAPEGMAALDREQAEVFSALAMRFYNEVLSGLERRKVMVPEESDTAACDSFARGFVTGAELDPVWVGNEDHWSFAAWAAFLGGRRKLASAGLLGALGDVPDAKATLYRTMPAIILSARDSFREARRAPATTAAAAPRAGRNDPCPCGSGKKFKRCCIDRGRGPAMP